MVRRPIYNRLGLFCVVPLNPDKSVIMCHVKRSFGSAVTSLVLMSLLGACFLSPPTPNAPVIFDPPAGSYEAVVEVSMSPLPPYSSVRYTVDGSAPVASSDLYTAPISLGATTTIRGVAVHANGAISSIVDAEYTVSTPTALLTANPEFSPAPGAYENPVQVSLTSATPGATIHYRIDGNDPTDSDNVYTAPISVESTLTIKAIATSPTLPDSEISTGFFTIGTASAGLTELFSYSGTGYELTDYSVGSLPASLTVDSLNAGDRLLLVPLYESPVEHLDAAGNPEPEVHFGVSYAGDPPPTGVQASSVPAPRPDLNDSGVSLPDLVEDEPPAGAESTESFRERNTRAGIQTTPTPHSVGDVIPFWFEANYGVGDYQSVSATVRYVGSSCYVVMTDPVASHPDAANYAEALGNAFDTNIYPRITDLFGYEWGGDPADVTELGGIDGEPRVYVVLNSVTADPPGGVYRATNQYLDIDAMNWWNKRSNEKEMFEIFLVSSDIDDQLDLAGVATHEFQHLIEFNQRYRIHAGAYESAYVNEGLSMIAEDLAGYGPDLYRIDEAQQDPVLSYIHWNKTPSYSLGQGYAAAYLMTNYMVRRFGVGIVEDLLESPQVGLDSFESVLSNIGFSRGYGGLVLDAHTAHYVDDATSIFAYPPGTPVLYSHDSGIDLRGLNEAWSATAGGLTTRQLYGSRVDRYDQYPAAPGRLEIDSELYEYGVSLYEFMSGDNGVFTLEIEPLANDLALRVLVKRAPPPAVPRIDGEGWDWIDSDLHLLDPAGETSAASEADILSVYAKSDTDYLYLLIETASPAPTEQSVDPPLLDYRVDLDLEGNGNYDYALYFDNTRPSLYQITPWASIDLTLIGLRYAAGEFVEVRIPYAPFGGSIKTTIKAMARFASTLDGGPAEWDETSDFFVVR